MKDMRRMPVTSSAYRMAGSPEAENAVIDPDNRYLWRMNSKRMEGEIIRDSVLAVARPPDPTLAGPELDPKLGLSPRRPTLYYPPPPEHLIEFLTLFYPPHPSNCFCSPT